jgi:hypothetical protein
MRNTKRWAYMGQPNYNPPNDDCPVCTEPSRTHFIGAKRTEAGAVTRWRCEHLHEWVKLSEGEPDTKA